MVNKFLKFNISSTPLLSGPYLVNADDIQSVGYQVAGGTITITLKGAVSINAGHANDAAVPATQMGARVITITCSNSLAAVVAPAVTLGRKSPDKAVYAAMTANPGGIQSTVQPGLDDSATPLQIYFTSYTIATTPITTNI